MLKFIKLNYDLSVFLNKDYTQHSGSCIKHQTHELADIHSQFGGFPKSYCLENTLIHQLWWTADQLDYAELGRQLGMEVITVSSILQPPGCVVPYHRDTFYQINQRYPDRTEFKVRANIYLENYKLGQFIQYVDEDEKIHTSSDWSAGDGFIWDSKILHLSTNAGLQDKYTLQVSGFLKHS
jgi:hypothetical protein